MNIQTNVKKIKYEEHLDSIIQMTQSDYISINTLICDLKCKYFHMVNFVSLPLLFGERCKPSASKAVRGLPLE